MSMMVSFVLSFFPRDVLDEILNLIGSVSEGFPSYSFMQTPLPFTPKENAVHRYFIHLHGFNSIAKLLLTIGRSFNFKILNVKVSLYGRRASYIHYSNYLKEQTSSFP